ncbi:inner membrane complex protein 1a [Plasmodium berghei]|uniref:Inner membrane complex protein 1a n=2 Tax=Plasmodium berghei TaxID=5821 RepID=A0A509ACV2_PLABA|nr:inner membrane complex protein 1a [Plasmodium berghei ANKA]AAQ11381.1 inner membrane complex protein 1 [Plasmodium berghei]CXH99437.1 inner membrane complex protein 1a [Plasmodium berghei]SCL91533.1 inner membrane complex protein 1a [Plasmodium berghei]SCM15485.1 inner membrane complex protein 1a [Plasmodium berghei]SCM17277.1 inner membrane complex protein 1a [Plasmodium berghei]|eukprot:XP_034420083.1 inner membrane complex protein 1a [Plasmodium berghei ANKA]
MFDACKINSNCCHDELGEDNKYTKDENNYIYEKNTRTNTKELKNIIEGKPDMTKSVEISQHTEREYVAITAYQPVDTVTKTVEVPFVRTIETIIPKITYESKIREVPKYYSKFVEKVVEVPEVKFVDKIVEVPRIQYLFKYAPKVEIKENIIKKPVIERKIIEKFVEVPEVKEMKRFQEVETVEYVIKYVPKGSKDEKDGKEKVIDKESEKKNEDNEIEENNVENEGENIYEKYNKKDTKLIKNISMDKEMSTNIGANMMLNQEDICAGVQQIYPYMFTRSMNESGMGINSNRHSKLDVVDNIEMMKINENLNSILPTPRIEQVFKPKIVKNIEVQKHVPISVDVPIPYMVPKPIVVNVDVPVLKFRDTFVPVPVRRKIIPKIKWISDIYQVDCIKERPYLKIQDIIKPVPCDIEIKYKKFMEKACPINPNELPQDDVHAMWIRVNSHLAEQKKKEYGNLYPYYRTELSHDNVAETTEEYKNLSEGKYMNDKEVEKEYFVSYEMDKLESKKREDGNVNIFETTKSRSDEGIKKADDENENEKAEKIESENSKNVEIWGNKMDSNVEVCGNKMDVNVEVCGNKMDVNVEVCGNKMDANVENGISFIQDGMVYNIEGFNNFMNESDINHQRTNLEEDPVAHLSQNHPLVMTYLQNKWISTDTLRTHELYNNNFINVSVNSNINLQNRNSFSTDLLQNSDFLKSAHHIISPFKPGNIKNIENCYNRIIMQNVQEENNKYIKEKYNKNNFDSNFNNKFIHEKNMDYSGKKKSDNSEDKCCNYFCNQDK